MLFSKPKFRVSCISESSSDYFRGCRAPALPRAGLLKKMCSRFPVNVLGEGGAPCALFFDIYEFSLSVSFYLMVQLSNFNISSCFF